MPKTSLDSSSFQLSPKPLKTYDTVRSEVCNLKLLNQRVFSQYRTKYGSSTEKMKSLS